MVLPVPAQACVPPAHSIWICAWWARVHELSCSPAVPQPAPTQTASWRALITAAEAAAAFTSPNAASAGAAACLSALPSRITSCLAMTVRRSAMTGFVADVSLSWGSTRLISTMEAASPSEVSVFSSFAAASSSLMRNTPAMMSVHPSRREAASSGVQSARVAAGCAFSAAAVAMRRRSGLHHAPTRVVAVASLAASLRPSAAGMATP
jgi:hypothetical protein